MTFQKPWRSGSVISASAIALGIGPQSSGTAVTLARSSDSIVPPPATVIPAKKGAIESPLY
jgi:hypothetical protein